MSSTATSEVSPGPEPPFPPHRSAPSLPVKCRIPRRAQKTLHIQHVSPDAQPPQALGPGSYGGAREHKSTPRRPLRHREARHRHGPARAGPRPRRVRRLGTVGHGVGAHRPSIVSKGFGGGPRLAPDASLASPGPGTYYDHGANLWIKRVGSGREGPSSRSRGSPHRTLSATTTTSSSSTARRAERSKTRSGETAVRDPAKHPVPRAEPRLRGPVAGRCIARHDPAPVPRGRVHVYDGVGDDTIGPDRYSPTMTRWMFRDVRFRVVAQPPGARARVAPEDPRAPGTWTR